MLIKVKEKEIVPDIVRLNSPESHGILEAYTQDDKMVITHAQNIDPILKYCEASRNEVDVRKHNFSEFEKIATIPEMEYLKHPEWNYDPQALAKWLKNEGKQYRTSRRRI